jgi:hypothetical protein
MAMTVIELMGVCNEDDGLCIRRNDFSEYFVLHISSQAIIEFSVQTHQQQPRFTLNQSRSLSTSSEPIIELDTSIPLTYIHRKDNHNVDLRRKDNVIRRRFHPIILYNNELAQESFPQEPGSCRRKGCQRRGQEAGEGCKERTRQEGQETQHRSNIPLLCDSLKDPAIITPSIALYSGYFSPHWLLFDNSGRLRLSFPADDGYHRYGYLTTHDTHDQLCCLSRINPSDHRNDADSQH